jgi:hypothetical protein
MNPSESTNQPARFIPLPAILDQAATCILVTQSVALTSLSRIAKARRRATWGWSVALTKLANGSTTLCNSLSVACLNVE